MLEPFKFTRMTIINILAILGWYEAAIVLARVELESRTIAKAKRLGIMTCKNPVFGQCMCAFKGGGYASKETCNLISGGFKLASAVVHDGTDSSLYRLLKVINAMQMVDKIRSRPKASLIKCHLQESECTEQALQPNNRRTVSHLTNCNRLTRLVNRIQQPFVKTQI